MDSAFTCGMQHEITVTTGAEHSARLFHPSLPSVFATPCLVGLMERVCAELMDRHLPEGKQSVGATMQLSHTAPTPLGMPVRIRTELIAVDGAKLTFSLQAWDEREAIARAEHVRYIVGSAKFSARVAAKQAGPEPER